MKISHGVFHIWATGGKLRKDGKSLEKSWKLQTIGAEIFRKVFVLLGFFPIDSSRCQTLGFQGIDMGVSENGGTPKTPQNDHF